MKLMRDIVCFGCGEVVEYDDTTKIRKCGGITGKQHKYDFDSHDWYEILEAD